MRRFRRTGPRTGRQRPVRPGSRTRPGASRRSRASRRRPSAPRALSRGRGRRLCASRPSRAAALRRASIRLHWGSIHKNTAMTLPPSDHFNGKTFFNPGERADRGLVDLLRWKLTSRAAAWPERIEVPRRPLPAAPGADGVVATWVGQSTVLLRSASATIITDPIFSERAGPVSWAAPPRAAAPGVDFGAVPRVDAVLLSHDHYDHCDLPTLRRLALRDDPVAVAPLGHRPLLEASGLRRVVELDWWQSGAGAPGVEVTLVPALHWCRRRPFGT